jgi:hypothetical protein
MCFSYSYKFKMLLTYCLESYEILDYEAIFEGFIDSSAQNNGIGAYKIPFCQRGPKALGAWCSYTKCKDSMNFFALERVFVFLVKQIVCTTLL